MKIIMRNICILALEEKTLLRDCIILNLSEEDLLSLFFLSVDYWLNNQVQLCLFLTFLFPYTNQGLVNAIWISNTPAIWPSSLFLTIALCFLICYCDVCLIWVQIIPCFEDILTVLMKIVEWFVTMQPWLLFIRSNEHWDNLHQHNGTKMNGIPCLVHGDLSKFLVSVLSSWW